MLERILYFFGFATLFTWLVTMLSFSVLHLPMTNQTFVVSGLLSLVPMLVAMAYTLLVTKSHRSINHG